MKTKRVAVVIPLYNHEAFIGQAIDSVLKQTLPPEKIIIIDDGSTDNSVEVVKKITDSRIELITQHNTGAHTALNHAIALAKGVDYIAILNSDDFYHPQRLERCVDFLEKDKTYDAVCTQVSLVDESGQALPPTDSRAIRIQKIWELPQEDQLEFAEWLGVANFLKTTSNIVAREAYLKSHFFRPYRYVHDYYFAIYAVLEKKLGVLFEPLLSYRTHSTNTIKSSDEAVKKEVLQMNIDLLRELGPGLSRSKELRRGYTDYFRAAIHNFSDFRSELYFGLLAHLIRATPPEAMAEFITEMKEEEFPEFQASPNRFILPAEGEEKADLNAYHAYKSEHVRRELNVLRKAFDKESLARLFLQRVIQSRWLALGRFLGRAKMIWKQLSQENVAQNQDSIKKAWEMDSWVKLGKKIRAKLPTLPW